MLYRGIDWKDWNFGNRVVITIPSTQTERLFTKQAQRALGATCLAAGAKHGNQIISRLRQPLDMFQTSSRQVSALDKTAQTSARLQHFSHDMRSRRSWDSRSRSCCHRN